MSRSLALCLALASCTEDRGLAGIWVSYDEETEEWRALDVGRAEDPEATTRLDYSLYLYDLEAPPRVVQVGLLSVDDGEVLFDVRGEPSSWEYGIRYAEPFERLSGRRIKIRDRIYERDTALPGGRVEPWTLGEAVFAVNASSGGTPGSVALAGDGTMWVGFTHISTGRAYFFDGRDFTGFGAVSAPFQPLVQVDGDLGASDNTAVRRYRVPPSDSFSWSPDGLADALVWETPGYFASLVELNGAWFAVEAGAVDPRLVRIDPETGAVEPLRELNSFGATLLVVGGDLLVSQMGPSPTPEIHGARSSSGWLLERVAPDGSTVFSHWSPGSMRIASLAMAGEDVIVALADGGEGVLGGPVVATQSARLAGLDAATGELLWERPVERYAGYGSVAALGEGVALAIGAMSLDLGGQIGVVGPTPGTGFGLAVAAIDACGEASEAHVFEHCGDACPGAPSPNGNATVGDLVVDPVDGTLVLSASVMGRFSFGRLIGGIDTEPVGVLLRLGAPTPAPACVPPAPFAPRLRLDLPGGVEVEVDGFGACTGACVLPVPPFAELRLRLNGGGVGGVSGACSQLPCTVYADVPDIHVTVTP